MVLWFLGLANRYRDRHRLLWWSVVTVTSDNVDWDQRDRMLVPCWGLVGAIGWDLFDVAIAATVVTVAVRLAGVPTWGAVLFGRRAFDEWSANRLDLRDSHWRPGRHHHHAGDLRRNGGGWDCFTFGHPYLVVPLRVALGYSFGGETVSSVPGRNIVSC